MKTARFIDHSLKLCEEPVPQIKTGEVCIKVMATAIGGSDEKILDGIKEALPHTVLGHETARVVEALGDGVSDVSEGDRVTVFSSITCGECLYCRSNNSNLCINRQTIYRLCP